MANRAPQGVTVTRRCAAVATALALFGFWQPAAATWEQTQEAIESLADSGRYADAIAREGELIELVAETFGDPSFELADAYLLMAFVFSEDAQYFEAEGRILQALDLMERIEGPLSTRLIDPFMALGENYHRAEEFDLALGAYNEARSLGRRSYGLFHAGQATILEKMSDSVYQLGNYVEARTLRREALALFSRDAAPRSIAVLEANYGLAAWFENLGQHRDADSQYSAIAVMIRTQFGADPALLVPLLRTAASNRRRGRLTASDPPGNPYELDEALRILRELGNPDPRQTAEVLLELADWQVAFERTWEVEDAYRAVADALERLEDGDALRRQWFSEMTVVYTAPLISRHLTYDEDAPRGRLTATFTIDDDGRPDDFEVVDSVPEGLLDRSARRQIMNSRFRPRLEDRVLVPSNGFMTWTFHYND